MKLVKCFNVVLYGKPISELWSVTCHMGSHSVTCHPIQVNVLHVNPSQIGQYLIYLASVFELLGGWGA